MRSFFVIILVLTISPSSPGAEIFPYFSQKYLEFPRLHGEIVPGDAELIRNFLANFEGSRIWRFEISSPGGDLLEAMKIGRLFREHDVGVYVDSGGCFSSCVLIIAGAVTRIYMLAEDPNPVGVHRPHFAQSLDDESVDNAYKNMRKAVDEYAKEMNLSGELVDLMFATPPTDTAILSEDQTRSYFPKLDPAFEAKVVNMDASYIGITPAEYRKRQSFAKGNCERTGPTGVRYFDYDCEGAILFGMSLMEYKDWKWACYRLAKKNDQLEDGYIQRYRCDIPRP